jgi:predicted  nucleic acid-binding Zn-ribbon protein
MSKTGSKPAAPPKGVIPPTTPGGRSGFLSDVIVELGFADREAVEQAVRAARSPGTTVARVLVDSGAIDEEQLAHATAERYGIAYIDLNVFAVEASAANLIKPTAARRYQAVPVGFVGGGLLVAMADPADALGVNDIAVMTKMDVKPAVASRPALDALLESLPLIDDDEDEAPPGESDASAGYAAHSHDEAPASSAVFWQEGEGTQDELPDDAAEASDEPATAAAFPVPADPGLTERVGELETELTQAREAAEARDSELELLQAKLTEAERELDDARTRARGVKETTAELEGLREQLTAAKAELDQTGARARDAERAADEATALKDELGSVKKELKRARADVEVRTEEMDSLRERLTAAETKLVRARSETEEARAALEELEDADRRAEQARQALTELREEAEKAREVQEMELRDLRSSLQGSETRRAELETRLAEVESSSFAAERAFEEMREAQTRMRGALRALAVPDEQKD